MSVVNGNYVLLYVEGQAIGCLTNCEFQSENEEIETTCKDDNGAYTSQSGSNRWRVSFEGNFNPASGFGLDDLLDIHMNKEQVSIKFRDTTAGGNNLTIDGEAKLNTLNWSGPLNSASVFSGEFSGQGVYTKSNT